MERELTEKDLECYKTDFTLAVESTEDTINSIIGIYVRLTYFEQAKGDDMNSERINTYAELRRKYRLLKFELCSSSLEQKIESIKKLHTEFYDLRELERAICHK